MRARIFITFLIVFFSSFPGFARVFFAGSNPSMTIFAFPQDLWLMPADYAFFMTTWQVQPWWGDIDQPDLRPSPTYLLTGEQIGVKGSGTYFKHNANLHNWKNITGLCRQMSPTLKLRFDLDYTFMPMREKAQGEAGSMSYDYKEGHSIQEIYLTSYAATYWRSIPLGFKFGLGRQASTEPDLDWTVNNGGAASQAQRLMWAWSTLQGSDVLGVEHGNARPQDEYTAGSQYRFDLQGAATLPTQKFGARLRYNTGKLDLYRWHGNGGWDPGVQSNLTGSYTNDIAKAISEHTVRAYCSSTWLQGEAWKFRTLTLSRFTMNDSDYVSPRNASISEGRKDHARTFVFQINPYVSLYPWKYKNTFVDLALLCNYSYTKYLHLQPFGVSGGQKDSYVGSTVYEGEDYVWYDYSYARAQFFEIAFDANPSFPIYGDVRQSVAANLSLLLWTRFKYMNKYYGQTVTSGSDLDFRINNIRQNFEHETWLNSVVSLLYRRDVVMYRLTVGQPLIYSLRPETRVYDAPGKTLISEVVHENMWVSQSGMSVGFFISSPIDNVPFVRKIPFGR